MLPLGPTGGPPRWNGGGGGPRIPGAGFVDCCNIKGSPLERGENTTFILNRKSVSKNTPNFCRAAKAKLTSATFTAVLQPIENKERYPGEEKVCCFTASVKNILCFTQNITNIIKFTTTYIPCPESLSGFHSGYLKRHTQKRKR